jgi:hypothetical protein
VRRCSSEQFKYEFRNGITVLRNLISVDTI